MLIFNYLRMIMIALSAEKYFKGTDKSSPHVGADLVYGMGINSVKWDK